MGPIATLWAREMAARGHDVDVVAAHPHYPPDIWPQRFWPYREEREGFRVLRLPLWNGHATALQRIREEVTYAASAAAAAPFLGRPDVIVAVSPSFLALIPTMAIARFRRCPWILWLQDILPDAAATTGLLESGPLIRAARSLERAAYRSAARVVVISDTFSENLHRKGVDPARIARIYNPATVDFRQSNTNAEGPLRILYVGNIGYSQGLVEFVRAFQAADVARFAKLVIVGRGECATAVRDAITTERVEMLGYVDREHLDLELRRASIGLVSQRADIEEFNVPSKLMNLMAQGIPVWANVRPTSETARIVSASAGGWVSNSFDPNALGNVLGAILQEPEDMRTRGERGSLYARSHFSPSHFAERFEEVLTSVVAGGHRA